MATHPHTGSNCDTPLKPRRKNNRRYTQLMCIFPHTHSEQKGTHCILTHTGAQTHLWQLKIYRKKNTLLYPGRQTPKSEDVLVSKQPRVHECSQPHHQSLSNYSHAPSLWHKSALISACCRIREYQLQHLLRLQTQPLKAQQSGSAGINKGRRGTGRGRGGHREKQRMKDRQTKAHGCVFLLVLFALGILFSFRLQSVNQPVKKTFAWISKQLCSTQDEFFTGN